MKLPRPYEMLLERLALLDQQIETLQARVAGDGDHGAGGRRHGIERTRETLLASLAAYAQRPGQIEREELSRATSDFWTLADDARAGRGEPFGE
jgi:hypothetical protein